MKNLQQVDRESKKYKKIRNISWKQINPIKSKNFSLIHNEFEADIIFTE